MWGVICGLCLKLRGGSKELSLSNGMISLMYHDLVLYRGVYCKHVNISDKLFRIPYKTWVTTSGMNLPYVSMT